MDQACMRGHKVAPQSKRKIRSVANKVRSALSAKTGKINVHLLVEFIFPEFIDDFIFEVATEEEMGTAEAVTFPDEKRIVVREDVYIDLVQGDPRARFTIAHEIGHLFLHQGVNALARDRAGHKVYEDSEWQADTFAAEFLMPYEECKDCSSTKEIMETFGVSFKAASIRFRTIQKT